MKHSVVAWMHGKYSGHIYISETSVVLERRGTTPWRQYHILRSMHSTKLPARHPYQADSIVSIVLDCLIDIRIEFGIKPHTFCRFRKLE